MCIRDRGCGYDRACLQYPKKAVCMSDEGYETFLMDLEDYKLELEERE